MEDAAVDSNVEKRAFEEKINALRKKTSACMMKSSNNRRERDSSEGW